MYIEREKKSKLILIAKCSIKTKAISYKIYSNSVLKNFNSQFHSY